MQPDDQIRRALDTEANMTTVPADQILRRVREAAANRSNRHRFHWGRAFEIAAAGVAVAAIIGIAAIRTMPDRTHPNQLIGQNPVGNPSAPPPANDPPPLANPTLYNPPPRFTYVETVGVKVWQGESTFGTPKIYLQLNEEEDARRQLVEAYNAAITTPPVVGSGTTAYTVQILLKTGGLVSIADNGGGNLLISWAAPGEGAMTVKDVVLSKAVGRMKHLLDVALQPPESTKSGSQVPTVQLSEEGAAIMATYRDPRASEEITKWQRPALTQMEVPGPNGKVSHPVWIVAGEYPNGGSITVRIDAFTSQVINVETKESAKGG